MILIEINRSNQQLYIYFYQQLLILLILDIIGILTSLYYFVFIYLLAIELLTIDWSSSLVFAEEVEYLGSLRLIKISMIKNEKK